MRNEAQTLPDLLQALDRLNYDPERLSIALIDDGSTDDSRVTCEQWAKNRTNWQVLPLEKNVGKAQALNQALAQVTFGEVIVIYDADERPEPDSLKCLLAPFGEARVGAVSGRRAVANALVSPAASYTTFEGLVHQLVTLRAKDRLDLAPAILGANCAYRRQALVEVGGFKPGALLEDSDLTLRLARSGWRVRYEPAAVSYHQVPHTVRGYWRQHTRWARGFNDVAKELGQAVLKDDRLSWPLRLELLIFSLGYLDRAALLGAAGLALIDRRWRRSMIRLMIISLATPFVQILAALKLAGAPARLWRQGVWVPLFFGLDVAMAVTGLGTTLLNLPQVWEERRARGEV